MNEFKRADSVEDILIVEGWWWIPQEMKNPQKVFGRLAFKESGARELLLFGIVPGVKEIGTRCSVIWGEIDGGKRVTLFNPMLVSHNSMISIVMTEKTIWSFSQLCIGDEWFSDSSAVKLLKYSFGINNLEVWHKVKGFFSEWKSRNHAVITYYAPESLLLYEDASIKITLEYIVAGLKSSIIQTDASIEHSARISLDFKNIPTSYQKVDFFYRRIYDFFALLIGGHTISFDHKGITGFDIITLDESSKEYKLPLITHLRHARTIVPYQLKKIRHDDILFPYDMIDEQLLNKILGKWLTLSDDITACTAGLIGFRNRINSFTPNTFPQLIFIFEGLHRALNPNMDDEALKRKETLLAKCPSSIVEDLRGITLGKASFPTRIEKALKDYHTIFPYIGKAQKAILVDLIRNVRNTAAHAKSNEEIIDFGITFNLARFLSLLMICMLMHESGMPQEKIYECLSNTQEYTEIKKSLTEEIAQQKA